MAAVNSIYGTSYPNTAEGVQQLLTSERERVRRNNLRSDGDYTTDLNDAFAALDSMDRGITELGDLGQEIQAGYAAITTARRHGWFNHHGLSELLSPLITVRDKVATTTSHVADAAIALDAAINRFMNGEPE